MRDACAAFGVTFDPWQDGAGRLILAKRADGIYACSIGGVVMSIPRQVGKTFLIGAVVFALCMLNPGLTVLWTAHRLRTANETFAKMQSFARRRKVAPHVAKIVLGSGDEEVVFHNGSRILFGARERGFGRGFDDVDVEVFDEAQILTENAIDDMIPAMNTAANPLPIYIGTPPKPSDPADVFRAKRTAALSGTDEDTAYVEFSADEGCDPDDLEQWRRANPSFPTRTPVAAMKRMRQNLAADSFVREALGVWVSDAQSAPSVISPTRWAEFATDDPPMDGTVAYGVKFSPDGLTVALSVALRPEVGPVHVEGVEHRLVVDGTRWLVEWLVPRMPKATVAIDGRAGTGALVKALRRAGVPERRIKTLTAEQAVTAHAEFLAATVEGTVSHLGDPALDESIAAAGRRPIGKAGGWGFQPIGDGDVTLAEAAVLAHWAAVNAPKPTTTGAQRRALVLS